MKKHIPIIVLILCIQSISLAQEIPESSIRFIENKNQWEANVLYRADLPAGKLYAEKSQLTYVFYDNSILAEAHDKHHTQSERSRITSTQPPEVPMMRLHAFCIEFLGANTQPVVTAEQKNPEYNNFYIGSDPSKWASGVNSYGKIHYKGVYISTDLSIFEKQGSMKYEFIVNPGGDPAQIKLRYKGVQRLFLQNGQLNIVTSVNKIVEEAPYIYQIIDGKEIGIPGTFELKDSIVSFKITGKYHKKYPLVIDPKLIFSTYSGSVADNWGNTAAFDEAGNMYSGGTVFGTGFPSTMGAYQQSFGGTHPFYGYGIDVGILKYNPTGTGLLYATYLGGNRTDVPYSLVVNNNDELIIFGSTSSGNFPVSATAYDLTFNGGSFVEPIESIVFENGSDLFVSRLSSDGSALLASTYIGGSGNDGILYQYDNLTKNYGDQLRGDVIVDDQNNVYVASNTRSFNFPVTPGALQTSLAGGGKDACVFKMNASLSTVLWSTYLGGTGEDASYSIQIDSLYNVFVAGGTNSGNFPVTSGVLHSTYQGGIDGFVSHIRLDGGALISSTYLGTGNYDQAYFVQLDSAENVYILGQTRGAYPVTPGAYNNPSSGQFIHKLSRDLTTSMMSTVIGTGGFNPNISLTAFLVNECGNIFLSGWGGIANSNSGYVGGSTTGMPVTADAFQTTTDGSDFYIMALQQNASALLYATFFGGNNIIEHVDGGTSRFDKKGIIYQAVCAGCGGSNDFPTTPGAWSNTNNSYFMRDGFYYRNCNNGAFKFDLATLLADFTVTKSPNCSNTIVNIQNNSIGGKIFDWDFGDGTTATGAGPFTHTYGSNGTYTITLIVTYLTTCIGKDTMTREVGIFPPPLISVTTTDTTVCKGDTVQLSATSNSYYTYSWSPNKYLNNATVPNPMASPDRTIIYTLTVRDTNDCVVTRNLKVQVVELDQNIDFENNSDCEGRLGIKLRNRTLGNVSFDWFFGDGHSYSGKERTIEYVYKEPGTYTVQLNVESNGCYFQDTVTFTLEKVFIPNLVTPNDDGLNDVYEIKENGNFWTLEVYNRWGKAIYKNSNYQDEWSGAELSDGIYYFLIISPNQTRCKGWVEILR